MAFAEKRAGLLLGSPGAGGGESRGSSLKAGAPGERGVGRRGSAYAYNVKELRDSEKAAAENAERAHEQMLRHWRQRGPKRRTDGEANNKHANLEILSSSSGSRANANACASTISLIQRSWARRITLHSTLEPGRST